MKNKLLYLFCFVSFSLFPQIYSFRTFTEDDGLSQSFINDINQDNRGFLYMATGNGLTTYGGTKFKILNTESGLANDFVTTIYNDHENKVWLGHLEGGITTIWNTGKIEAVKFKEEIGSKIIQILEIATNKYIFLKSNEGIILYDEETKEYSNLKEDVFYEVLRIVINKDELLLLKSDGIYSIKTKALLSKNYSLTKKFALTDGALMRLNVQMNTLIVLDNTIGALTFKVDNGLTPIDTFRLNKSESSYYTKIVSDRFSNIYISTTDNGIYKINPQTKSIFNYTIKNGLTSNAVQSVFVDREDNLWIGTYGNGLQQLTNELYSFNYLSQPGHKLSIHAALKIHGKIILASSEGLGYFTNDKIDYIQHPSTKGRIINGLIQYKSTIIFSNSDGELFYSDTLFKKITKINLKTVNQKLIVNYVTHDEDNILVCTTSGLYIINPVDYSYRLLNSESGLLHNNVKFFFEDSKRRVWVCSPGNLI